MPNLKTLEKKKAVLIRLPLKTYEQLLILSAEETVIRRRTLSVPGLAVELLEERLKEKEKR